MQDLANNTTQGFTTFTPNVDAFGHEIFDQETGLPAYQKPPKEFQLEEHEKWPEDPCYAENKKLDNALQTARVLFPEE